jgi:hypothetical protein
MVRKMKNWSVGANGKFDTDLASYSGIAVVLRYSPSHIASNYADDGVDVAVVVALSAKRIDANLTFPKLFVSPLYRCFDNIA